MCHGKDAREIIWEGYQTQRFHKNAFYQIRLVERVPQERLGRIY